MGEQTNIEWCHHTFNLVIGCAKVSPACANCYAETFAKNRMGLDVWGADKERKVMSENYWRQPLNWNREAEKAGERRRVFCSSMADVFEDHPTVNAQRRRLFDLIDQTPNLDWLLLSKRPENIWRMLIKPPYDWCPRCNVTCHVSLATEEERERLFYLDDEQDEWKCRQCDGLVSWTRKNVWLGTTAENQHCANERIPELIAAPAVIHFVSAEPLLESFDLQYAAEQKPCGGPYKGKFPIDWLIVGGESGPKSRVTHPSCFQHMRWQAEMLGVKFFFKQHGEYIAKRQWIMGGRSLGDIPSRAYGNAIPIGGDEAYKVGKKLAGNLLDGECIQEFPV
jgi:protein gp37